MASAMLHSNQATFGSADLLRYLRHARLASVSTLARDGAPQAALVGIGVMDDLRVVFDTVSTSRKHVNLLRDPRIALVVAGPNEQTLQYEGTASLLPLAGAESAAAREAYYLNWPDGRTRLAWPTLSYWCIMPNWARYSDFAHGPLIVEFSCQPQAPETNARPASPAD